jgi:transposase
MKQMGRYSQVGMQELDQRLSKIVEAARKQPVSVYRYGAPWVWIVSQDDWQGAVQDLSSYIPHDHALVRLRQRIEHQVEDACSPLCGWADEQRLHLPLPTLLHALLLQLLYSLPCARQLYEQLNYNLLYRWFVGLELHQRLCSCTQFMRDVQHVVDNPYAVRLLACIAAERLGDEPLLSSDFCLNTELLQRWQARHSAAANNN